MNIPSVHVITSVNGGREKKLFSYFRGKKAEKGDARR